MLTWIYKNKHYLIIFCQQKIPIVNIFEEEESYGSLYIKGLYKPKNGFIYNDNYLCVIDSNNGCLRIWDLITKIQYKRIFIDFKVINGILLWDKIYAIISITEAFILVNLEEGKVVNKIKSNQGYNGYNYMNKIRLSDLGECLICSSSYGIHLYDTY